MRICEPVAPVEIAAPTCPAARTRHSRTAVDCQTPSACTAGIQQPSSYVYFYHAQMHPALDHMHLSISLDHMYLSIICIILSA